MCRFWCVAFAAGMCWLAVNQAFAGPAADVMVAGDVFTIGDGIDVWVTAVNPTHECEVDVYLAGTTEGCTMYLGPSGWTADFVPLFAGFLMPQFAGPVTVRLGTIHAGEPPALPNKACTLRLTITPSNVREMVYCEDEARFSVAPEGFVAIPSGRFLMGTGHTANPRPGMVPHKVCLDSFFMAETETTVSQFAAFLNDVGAGVVGGFILGQDGATLASLLRMPIEFKDGVFAPAPGGEDYPADVEYPGAEGYVLWKGAKLPTEAQWEYAARAFAPGDYPWGDEGSCDRGNIFVGGHACSPTPLSIRSFAPNDFGLYEVCGNSSEICGDWFDLDIAERPSWGKTYYEWCFENYPEGIVNPQGPPGPPPGGEVCWCCPFRVVRGGPPDTDDYACKLWARHMLFFSPFAGFRAALEPPK